MLVLSRKLGESLRIGEDIEITVVEVKGDGVRLGITAPRSVQVWRSELWHAIAEQNRKAAEAATSVHLPADLDALLKNTTTATNGGKKDG